MAAVCIGVQAVKPPGDRELPCVLVFPADHAADNRPEVANGHRPSPPMPPHLPPYARTGAKAHPGRVGTGLRLDSDVHARLRRIAFDENSSIQQLVEEGIALLLQSREKAGLGGS